MWETGEGSLEDTFGSCCLVVVVSGTGIAEMGGGKRERCSNDTGNWSLIVYTYMGPFITFVR